MRGVLRVLVSAIVALTVLAPSSRADEQAADALFREVIQLRLEGKYVEAASKAQLALVEAKAAGLPQAKPGTYASYLYALGEVCTLVDEFDCARAALGEALEIRKVSDVDAVPDSMRALSGLYQRMGQYKEAEPLLAEIVQIHEQRLATHADAQSRAKLGGAQTRLGILYREIGKLGQAEEWLKKGLRLYEQLPAHVRDQYVADSKLQLAALYRDRAETRQAEPLAQEAVEIRSRSGNPQWLASARLVFADILRLEGRLEDAERQATLALEARKKEFGPDSLSAASALRVQGVILESRERLADAEKAYREALKIRIAKLPPDHPSLAAIQANLGALLKSTGKLEEAETLLQSALRIREMKLGPGHPDTIKTLDTLGDLMRRAGRPDKARELFEKADRHRRSSVYQIRILFGTNRATKGSVNGQLKFGSAASDALSIGIADVRVPDVRRGRSQELAQTEEAGLSGSERPQLDEVTDSGHMAILGYWPKPAKEMLDLAAVGLQKSQVYAGKALIFIHGFNNDFDSALVRAAQLAYDLQFDGPVFLYSWPAQGGPTVWDHIRNLFSYTRDRTSAANARGPFANFLRQVLVTARPAKTLVIAHSMGNRLLLETLRDAARTPGDGIAAMIGDLVFAAPDIPRSEFKTFMEELRLVGVKTMYAARSDRALQAAHWVWSEPPAGLILNERSWWQFWKSATPSEPFVAAGVETIDVSAAANSGPLDVFSANHDLYAASPGLIEDMRELLEKSVHPPDTRGKERFEKKKSNGVGDSYYWVLRRRPTE
jgi:esterase/lipase superfamily enzyme